MQNPMFSIAAGVAKGNFGLDVIYCMHEDKFYLYRDGYWDQVFDIELLGMICEHEKVINLGIQNYAPPTKEQILKSLKMLVRKPMGDFNVNGWLNFPSGMFDVEGGNFIDHSKNIISTIRLPYAFNSSAMCPLWAKSLLEIFEGSIAKMEVLQEYFGYCLTRDTSLNKALLLLGESNSGKSTILEVLRNLIGAKNCSSVPMKFLSNPQYTPLLINKLVNIDADVGEDAKEFEATFKIITRGEPVSCNQKFVPTFEFTPYCKIIMAANTFPRITDHSSAFYNRLVVIPCNRVFDEPEQNRALPSLLKEELPGIFQWALAGYKRLKKRGMFDKKDFVREAIQDLRDESNPVDVFFRENIEADISGKSFIEKIDLYDKYGSWCRTNGNAPMSAIKFGRAVYQKYANITEKKSQDYATGRRIWRNLKYKNTHDGQTNIGWQD